MSKRANHPKFVLGMEFKAAGKYVEAAQAFEEGLTDQPDYAPAWWLLGGIYWTLGDYARSIDSCRRAVELRPRNEKASIGLFQSLLDAGQVEEAIAEARRFLVELEGGASCTAQTARLYRDYDRDGVVLAAEWLEYKATSK